MDDDTFIHEYFRWIDENHRYTCIYRWKFPTAFLQKSPIWYRNTWLWRGLIYHKSCIFNQPAYPEVVLLYVPPVHFQRRYSHRPAELQIGDKKIHILWRKLKLHNPLHIRRNIHLLLYPSNSTYWWWQNINFGCSLN